MRSKVKSLSKCGANIDRLLSQAEYSIEDQKLQQILQKKMASAFPARKKSHSQFKGRLFEQIPGRQTLSPFQMFNTKDVNSTAYTVPVVILQSQQPNYSLRKEISERLVPTIWPKVLDNSCAETCSKGCLENKKATRNEQIKTPKDLQAFRRTFHSFDFSKQTDRPFDASITKLAASLQLNKMGVSKKQLQPEQTECEQKPRRIHTSLGLQSIHAFQSYTKRQFLQPKNLTAAQQVSGMNSNVVLLTKFKPYKSIQPPAFQQMQDKFLNRFDREEPWNPKLSYNVKQGNRTSSKSGVVFQKQANRRCNEIKSSYPIRLAL